MDAVNEPMRTYEESAACCWSCKLQQRVAGLSHMLSRLQQLDAANEPTRTYEDSAAGCRSWNLQQMG